MEQDQEHLRLLTIFYYIYAGITAFSSLIPGVYLILGLFFIMAPPATWGNNPSQAPPAFVGWLMIGFGAGIMILGFAFAFAVYYAGKSLGERKRYLFCMILAGFLCIGVPFGTILAIFTFMILSRPSVKALFNQNP